MRKHCRHLTPASGRQDHTTSPSAATSFVEHAFARLTPPASIASHPHVRDDREPPLFWGGTYSLYCCFYQFEKQNIFQKGMDRYVTDLPIRPITPSLTVQKA